MPTATPDVSIIIVNYKTPQLIIDCLHSVFEHTQGVSVEVIIVDNESGDNSESLVRGAFPEAQFPQVRWFDMGYNAGFGRANNFGMKQARGRNVLLFNSDTLLVDDLISRCSQLLDQQADVAAVGAMQINREGQVHPQLFTRFAQLRRFCYILPERWLNRIFPDSHYADPNQVDWIIGAFLMTRQTTIGQTGGFDERFFMYGEDVEWCWRLGKQGRMLVLHDGFFVHLEYGSDISNATRKVTFINRFKTQMQLSNLLWIRKQYGAGAYLLLMIHYYTLVPIVYGWKISINLRQGKPLFSELTNQRAFAQQVGIFSRFFWATLFNQNRFFKV
ncbi:glycosyltransferase family 2 protein [Fibrella aquatilis]|uniref:Glycosyltransferase family 2 protein n=1 Tax=Fibrella aquatilis TaxID=2817059 RepID=A0A939JY37_9BACT|nr:glycosyltransferase family 2 protein [Fibrella aquatilis]MBO0929948.1 glycosyltransferase family 2 protein [Fibrella aquatilis]